MNDVSTNTQTPVAKLPTTGIKPAPKPAAKGGGKAATTGVVAQTRTTVSLGDSDLIVLQRDKEGKRYGKEHNPKRRTAAQRFALYEANSTVGAYRKAVTKWGGNAKLADRDIAWDKKMGWLKVEAGKSK